jgi:hypothetical protein
MALVAIFAIWRSRPPEAPSEGWPQNMLELQDRLEKLEKEHECVWHGQCGKLSK